MNNNQGLIDALRELATFLESKPNMPLLGKQVVRLWTYDKEKLKVAARELGTCKKTFTESFFNLTKTIAEGVLEFEVTIAREEICKKVVTWDCPDDESLLKIVEAETVTEGQ